MAEVRIREAEVLLRQRCPAGAYYLAGYAVECALKACIARHARRFTFPDKGFANRVWTHDLNTLLNLADLKAEYDEECKRSGRFAENWNVVKDWSEDKRYRIPKLDEAKALVGAINHATDGVLQWLRKHC